MSGGGSLFQSRRRFVAGASSLLGGLAMPALRTAAFAQPIDARLPPLRSDDPLPGPDFKALRKKDPFVAGVRPYREGGVHLALEDQPIQSPSGPKYVIHNYGHGGAGITLSWGCASVVADHVATVTSKLQADHKRPSVAVLGTGIIGLTVATELRRKWPHLPITVYAKDLNVRHTTSYVAGGQFEPSGIHDDYQTADQKKPLFEWLKRSRARVEGIQRSGQRLKYGVAERLNYTLDHDSPGFDLMNEAGVVAPPRLGMLPLSNLGAITGREYKTWLINPTILLPQLVADLVSKNVAFKTREFKSLQNVFELKENVIINCTGYGAKMLFNDPKMKPKRGHLIVLRKTLARQFYFVSGGCSLNEISYVFCRQNDIVVGGSVHTDDDNASFTPADEQECQRILGKAEALFAGDIAKCNALNIASNRSI